MTTRFRPLLDRVLVRRLAAEERTAAGIIIPDTAEEKPAEGEVLAVGPGVPTESGKLRPPDVKVGDRVLFAKSAGMEVIVHGAERVIMRAADVLGVIEEAT